MSDIGYHKVGHKARRGRRGSRVGHGGHRKPRAVGNDSLSKGRRRQMIFNRERAQRPTNRADLADEGP